MNISKYTIITLRDIIIGDSKIKMPRLTGRQITDLFNSFCAKKEIYPDDWIDTGTGITGGRKQYTEKRLKEINNTYELTKLVERVIQPVYFEQHGLAYDQDSVDSVNQLLTQDGYAIENIQGVNKVTGSVAPDEVKIKVHFEEIQSQILDRIREAKYTIWVAVAWFTDKDIMRALHDKQRQGLNVQIIVYDDDINQNWGVLKPDIIKYFDIMKVKYENNTKMHNKFCIIDLQTVIHGSYNWTEKARYNDETIQIIENRESAMKFSDEFIRLKLIAKK